LISRQKKERLTCRQCAIAVSEMTLNVESLEQNFTQFSSPSSTIEREVMTSKNAEEEVMVSRQTETVQRKGDGEK